MPKQRITKQMVVDAAFALARERGMECVLVKDIADKMGCSVQPIYTCFESMEGLRQAVIARAEGFVKAFVAERMDREDMFRSIGRAYVHLATEEPHLFKLFMLHKREGISTLDEFYRAEGSPFVAPAIAGALGISVSNAKQLHLNMLIYTLGVGIILSSTTPGVPAEELIERQDLAYEAFLNQALQEEGQL